MSIIVSIAEMGLAEGKDDTEFTSVGI